MKNIFQRFGAAEIQSLEIYDVIVHDLPMRVLVPGMM